MGPGPSWQSGEPSPRQPSFRMSSGQLGMALLLVALTVLFGASLVAYAITRAQNDRWLAPGMPPLPDTLWLSSALMVLVSVTMETGLARLKLNRLRSTALMLRLTWLLVAGFAVCQLHGWQLLANAENARVTLYPFTFFFLTGLHAAHVLAGLVPLWIVTSRLGRGEYSSSRLEGFKFCVQYWHFLGGVWLVLFGALKVFT